MSRQKDYDRKLAEWNAALQKLIEPLYEAGVRDFDSLLAAADAPGALPPFPTSPFIEDSAAACGRYVIRLWLEAMKGKGDEGSEVQP